MTSAEPTIFGRYQLLDRIAKGGMAEVFKAKLNAAAGTEKVLCIKRILPKHSENHEFLSLFVKEAKISLSLTHGNITQVFDFGEVDGTYYLAMEYILGQDLSTALYRIREVDALMDLPAALHVAAEVCKGLQYAHSYADPGGKTLTVVHRDVTPHNILISYSGEVKLTDFGIALAATKVSPSEGGVVRGKACYLSPEQADGSPGTVKSDIFSLGAVLYEMLTGIRPFDAETEKETLERVRTLQLEPPSEHNPEVDPELDRIVLKALARNPDERYERAADLQVALTGCLHKRSPDYTGQKLAEMVKDLFAWEIAGGQDGDGDKQRERLLFQLSRHGVMVDAKAATTEELLELGTVAIQGATAPSGSDGRRWIFGVAVILVLILGGVGFAVWPDGSQVQTPGKVDAEVEVPRVKSPIDPPTSAGTKAAPIPAQPAPKAKPTNVAPQRKVAYLNCNSWPWSVVYVNGRKLRGNTPHYRVKVYAGNHKIRFVNPELNLSKEVTVTVDPGNTKTVAVSLQQQ